MTTPKSNLDQLFKTDGGMESEGIWFQVSPTVEIRCRRFGGTNSSRVKAASAKYFKPFARQIDAGALPEEKVKEITVRAFVESCLVDWKGVEIDGKDVPFSQGEAIKLLSGLPELADLLIKYCTEKDSFRVDLGNS